VSQAPKLTGFGRYMAIATPLETKIAHKAPNCHMPYKKTNGK
jgi:hypothetical protein